jgi:hypothetical protein
MKPLPYVPKTTPYPLATGDTRLLPVLFELYHQQYFNLIILYALGINITK